MNALAITGWILLGYGIGAAVMLFLHLRAPLVENDLPAGPASTAVPRHGTPPPSPAPIRVSIPGVTAAPSVARKVRIVRCSDKMMWYADHIGYEFVPEGFQLAGPVGQTGYYWTRETSGYRNIVNIADTELV